MLSRISLSYFWSEGPFIIWIWLLVSSPVAAALTYTTYVHLLEVHLSTFLSSPFTKNNNEQELDWDSFSSLHWVHHITDQLLH